MCRPSGRAPGVIRRRQNPPGDLVLPANPAVSSVPGFLSKQIFPVRRQGVWTQAQLPGPQPFKPRKERPKTRRPNSPSGPARGCFVLTQWDNISPSMRQILGLTGVRLLKKCTFELHSNYPEPWFYR